MRKIQKLLNIIGLESRYYVFNNPILKIYDKYSFGESGGVALDIGCGSSPRNLFNLSKVIGCDINEKGHNIIHCDLSLGKLPFETNSIDLVTAYDVLEHIPRVVIENGKTRFPFVELMSEIYRILNKKGIFFSHTPAYPFSEVFVDPTHVNLITEDTLKIYFCENMLAKMYGFKGEFKLLEDGFFSNKYFALLMKNYCP
jgi:SAM-dependent methyltransferase